MKKYLAKMDLWLLTSSIIYAILGCIMIYSASSILTVLKQGVPSNYYFFRQSMILIGSFAIGLIVLKVPTSKYRLFAPLLVIGIIVSLIGLYVSGKIVNGALGWYDLGFFSLQPSEFAKSVMILFMAVYYNKLIKQKETNSFKYLVPVAIGIIMCGLIYEQSDLGSAVILGCLILGIYFAVPINKEIRKKNLKVYGIICVLGILFILVAGKSIFSSYQLSRFNFQKPCSRYTESTGYQVCNGYIAIKNGGLFGLGFGASTQKYLYLPEAHTDFIFPIICEELGLFVGIAVLLGYGFILFRILKIARNANNVRNSILAYGTFFYLLLHIFVNILGVLAIIPLTGVPLPLLSYGGSYNVNVVIMLCVTQRVSIESKESKIKQKIAQL